MAKFEASPAAAAAAAAAPSEARTALRAKQRRARTREARRQARKAQSGKCRRLQPRDEPEQHHALQGARDGIEKELYLDEMPDERRADEQREHSIAGLRALRGAPDRRQGKDPQREPGCKARRTRGRGDLDHLVVCLVMRLGHGTVARGVAPEDHDEVLRAPSEHRTRGKALDPRLPGGEPALDAGTIDVEPQRAQRRGVGEFRTGQRRTGDADAGRRGGEHQQCQGDHRQDARPPARKEGSGKSEKAHGREEPDDSPDRTRKRQGPEMKSGSEQPRDDAEPARRGRAARLGRRLPAPPAPAARRRRDGGGRRRGLRRGEPRPHRKAERHHCVDQHVAGEKGRVAEGSTQARQFPLGQPPVERNVELEVACDHQQRDQRADRRGNPEQRPPCRAAAEHRHQHHGECEPVGAVDDPQHALVSRPEAPLGALAGQGREQRDAEAGGEQHEQPGPGRAVLRAGKRQHGPKREHDLDDRTCPQGLAHDEGKNRLRRDHEGRQQEERDAGEHAEAQEFFERPKAVHQRAGPRPKKAEPEGWTARGVSMWTMPIPFRPNRWPARPGGHEIRRKWRSLSPPKWEGFGLFKGGSLIYRSVDSLRSGPVLSDYAFGSSTYEGLSVSGRSDSRSVIRHRKPDALAVD